MYDYNTHKNDFLPVYNAFVCIIRYSVNGSEKLDSSGLNLNWIKMLTRTREYIPGARVFIRFRKRLGKSTNIYQHI